MSRVVTTQIALARRGRPRKDTAPAAVRPAKIALTLALAHKIQRAIDAGTLADRADAARRLGLTRARMTQILDLLLLAPDIQESILFLNAGTPRPMLPHLRTLAWSEQRVLWARDGLLSDVTNRLTESPTI